MSDLTSLSWFPHNPHWNHSAFPQASPTQTSDSTFFMFPLPFSFIPHPLRHGCSPAEAAVPVHGSLHTRTVHTMEQSSSWPSTRSEAVSSVRLARGVTSASLYEDALRDVLFFLLHRSPPPQQLDRKRHRTYILSPSVQASASTHTPPRFASP